jgi:hypothetical protein
VAAPDFNELRNDIGDRLSRVNLVCARGAKQRLNLRNVAEDERALVSCLAVIVRCPGFQTRSSSWTGALKRTTASKRG